AHTALDRPASDRAPFPSHPFPLATGHPPPPPRRHHAPPSFAQRRGRRSRFGIGATRRRPVPTPGLPRPRPTCTQQLIPTLSTRRAAPHDRGPGGPARPPGPALQPWAAAVPLLLLRPVRRHHLLLHVRRRRLVVAVLHHVR